LFRLNTVENQVPPLPRAREDIPAWPPIFLRQRAQRYRKSVFRFEAAALQLLQVHSWPGNVRELDHAVERAVLMAQGKHREAADLGLRARGSTPRLDDMSLDDVERYLIKKTLSRAATAMR